MVYELFTGHILFPGKVRRHTGHAGRAPGLTALASCWHQWHRRARWGSEGQCPMGCSPSGLPYTARTLCVQTNNEMLKLMMDVKGPFPKKMVKVGALWL